MRMLVLAMSHIESGAATHVGRRTNNEDSHRVEPGRGFFAVADGLGGHEGGEVASQLALEAMVAFLSSAEELEGEEGKNPLLAAVAQAHAMVRSQQKGKLYQMATTVAAILLQGLVAEVCNLGDSRIFLLRGGELRQLTQDHTVLAEMIATGMDVSSPFCAIHRHSLTGAVGMEATVEAHCNRVLLQPGDVLLLCSDGLYEPVKPDRVVELLQAEGTAQALAERLVEEAYTRGGTDNITAVVVRVRP
jgi:serine/threonine protein phosphatase PrpC